MGKVRTDYFSFGGKDYLLVVYYYSKYPEVVQVHSKTPETTIAALKVYLLDMASQVKSWQTTCHLTAGHSSNFLSSGISVRETTAKLHVDPQARPKIYRPRSVPYTMREKVDVELDHFHQQGIIEPVQFSNWAAPVVPVLKQDGNVRIYGDNKLTVNAVAKLDTYPLPRIHYQVGNIFLSLTWFRPTYNYLWMRLQESV